MTLGKLMVVTGMLGVATLGIYLIAIITPKLADWIDKLRGRTPDPYDGVPNPARVEEADNPDPTPEEESGENQENKDNGDI